MASWDFLAKSQLFAISGGQDDELPDAAKPNERCSRARLGASLDERGEDITTYEVRITPEGYCG
jgi:hypothetical protein